MLWRKFHRIIPRYCVGAVTLASGVEEIPPPGVRGQTDVTHAVYISQCMRTGQCLCVCVWGGGSAYSVLAEEPDGQRPFRRR